MATKATVIRKALRGLEFPFWVRAWRDGEIWAGPKNGFSSSQVEALETALLEAGYRVAKFRHHVEIFIDESSGIR